MTTETIENEMIDAEEVTAKPADNGLRDHPEDPSDPVRFVVFRGYPEDGHTLFIERSSIYSRGTVVDASGVVICRSLWSPERVSSYGLDHFVTEQMPLSTLVYELTFRSLIALLLGVDLEKVIKNDREAGRLLNEHTCQSV